jgi:hypothetical protein
MNHKEYQPHYASDKQHYTAKYWQIIPDQHKSPVSSWVGRRGRSPTGSSCYCCCSRISTTSNALFPGIQVMQFTLGMTIPTIAVHDTSMTSDFFVDILF